MTNKQLNPMTRMPFWRDRDMEGFTGFRRQLERFFEDAARDWPLTAAWHQNGFAMPKVDLVETDAGLELTADLPGVDAQDIALEIEDDRLLLKAAHSAERREDDDKRHYHLVERAQGEYQRSFSLPFRPESDAIKADFEKGVLKVMIPRNPKDNGHKKRIAVGSAQPSSSL